MKNECIVCAKNFESIFERFTCSVECKEKWLAFLEELKTVPAEEREAKMDHFFSRMYLKMLLDSKSCQ